MYSEIKKIDIVGTVGVDYNLVEIKLKLELCLNFGIGSRIRTITFQELNPYLASKFYVCVEFNFFWNFF